MMDWVKGKNKNFSLFRYIREESVCGTGGGIAMNIDNIFDSST